MRCGILLMLIVVGSRTSAPTGLAAQVPEVASRGPRFFYAAAASPRTDASSAATDARRAAVLRQRLSLMLHDVPLADALREIARRGRLQLLYSSNMLPAARHVSLDAKQITVAAALTEILLDTGIDVVLTRSGQMTLVRRWGGHSPAADSEAVAGRVVDAKSSRGIAGAEVLLEHTRWTTSTDSGGRYRLVGIEPGSYTMTVRRFGYAKQSRQITVRGEQEDTVDVALEPVAAKLEELVTTATGRQRRRDLGNAITTIRADSVLRSAPIRNLTDLLDTRVPGLTVRHTSGAPGDPARLRLRGLGSVMRSNDPVVIVDGVRIYAAQSETRSGNLTNAYGSSLAGPQLRDMNDNLIRSNGVPAPSPLDQIDPNIIETIEVFKGPSAATLYGADAANGVIVITTKKGRPGPTRWTASIAHGRTVSPGRYAQGYYRWGHNMFNGAPQFCPLSSITCVQDSLVRFQALNEPSLTLFGHGQRTALSLTASGGTQALTYSVTGSYSDETGLLTLPDFEAERFRTLFNREAPDWMRRPHHLKDWSVTSSITALLSRSADVTLLTTLSRSEQQRTSLENQVTSLVATYVDTVNRIYYRPEVGYGVGNATPAILKDYYVRTMASAINFTTQLSANWRPRSWFNAMGQAGLNVIPRADELLLPAGLVAPTDSGTVARGTGRSLVSTFNLQGTLHKPLGGGLIFETNLGANITTTSTTDLTSSASGLVPGTSSISGATRVQAGDAATNTSVFGYYVEPRVSGRTIALSTGLRLDGGSAYGARITRTGNGGGGFLRSLLSLPKLNGSWVVSEEPWFPFNALFSSLRLRGAYGQAQVQPGPADRLRIYSRTVEQGGRLTVTGVGNTQLRPERSTEFEGGFDADVLDSRVSLELTAYRKMQVDALLNVQLPQSVNGGGSITKNIGNIRNTGLEFTVGLTPVQRPALTWSTQLTFSRNSNTLVKLGPGVDPNPRQGIVAGYPVGSRWALPILGFADHDGDGVLQRDEIQVGDSLVYVGRLLPAYTAALHTNVVLFGGAVGLTAGFSYDGGASQVNQTARTNWVLARALVDARTPLGEQAAVVALDATDYGIVQSVSTLRFHSLSVNYRAPAPVARLLRAQQLTVAVQGSNLGMHSNYRGKDPDVNAWGPGEDVVDTGQLPQPRTWQLAVYLQY